MLVDPITGEVLEDDFDSLAAAVLRIKAEKDKLFDAERKIKDKIAEMALGSTKTRHVRGDKYEADVVAGDPQWSQPLLKKAWEDFPEGIRNEILRIGQIAVNAREWNTWKTTSGTPEFEKCKSKIQAAFMGLSPTQVKVYAKE